MWWVGLAVVAVVGLVVIARSRSSSRSPKPPPGPRLVISSRGREAGTPPEPLILFGHLGTADGPQTAGLIASHSTLNCVLIEDLETLRRWLSQNEAAGILAMSRPSAPGEAATAISEFRQRQPKGRAALYQAWDYNVGRGAARALECGADAVMMPAIDANEMFNLLFQVLGRVTNGAEPPNSVEEHEALLRELAPNSAFWELQDRVQSPYY